MSKGNEVVIDEQPSKPDATDRLQELIGDKAEESSKQDQQESKNTIFTEEAKNAALEHLRKRRGELKSGIDPQEMLDAITVGGYYIEQGTRKFAAWDKQMIEDIGEWIKPYLKGTYENIRRYPGMEQYASELSSTSDVDNYVFEAKQQTPTERIKDLFEDDNAAKPQTESVIAETAETEQAQAELNKNQEDVEIKKEGIS